VSRGTLDPALGALKTRPLGYARQDAYDAVYPYLPARSSGPIEPSMIPAHKWSLQPVTEHAAILNGVPTTLRDHRGSTVVLRWAIVQSRSRHFV